MREVGLNPRTGGGKRGDAKRLQEQMMRLFRALISFEDTRETHIRYLDMQVAPKAELWWDASRTQQDNLWDSWIELGESFYEAVITSSVPVDLRALPGAETVAASPRSLFLADVHDLCSVPQPEGPPRSVGRFARSDGGRVRRAPGFQKEGNCHPAQGPACLPCVEVGNDCRWPRDPSIHHGDSHKSPLRLGLFHGETVPEIYGAFPLSYGETVPALR